MNKVLEHPEIVNIVNHTEFSVCRKTSLLRDWVYRHAAYNPNGEEVNNYLAAKSSILSIDDVLKICSLKGVTCGGFAELLRRLYMELGYFSCVMGFGKLGSPYTHAATLVLVQENGDDRLILQDPTFNITFMDEQGYIPSVTDLFQNMLSQTASKYYRVYDVGVVGKNKIINPKEFYKHPYYPLVMEDREYKVALTFEGWNMAVIKQAKDEGLDYEDAYFEPVENVWYFGLDDIPTAARNHYFQSIPGS